MSTVAVAGTGAEHGVLSAQDVRAAALRLDVAERDRVQTGQLSLAHPGMTIDDAYAVQRAWVRAKLDAGHRQVGRKIGLTSAAMQRLVHIDTPDHGVLLDSMVIEADSTVEAGRFITPRIEMELAFVLREPLSGPDCTVHDVLRVTEFVVPALEVIDARIARVDAATGHTRTVVDTIADNAANAGLVLGGTPVPPDRVDLRWQGGILSRNGVLEESGVAGAVLGHPARGVAWLANRLAPYGERLDAGQVILSGAFTAALDARPGDLFHADFGRLGAVGLRFEEES